MDKLFLLIPLLLLPHISAANQVGPFDVCMAEMDEAAVAMGRATEALQLRARLSQSLDPNIEREASDAALRAKAAAEKMASAIASFSASSSTQDRRAYAQQALSECWKSVSATRLFVRLLSAAGISP